MRMDKLISMNLLQALLVIYLAAIATIKAQTPKCTTPSAGTGTCVPANECHPVIDFIQRNSPLSQADKEILRSYQCTVDNSLRVCCPDSKFVIPSSNNSDNELPPDVTVHKNFNLLPTECGIAGGRFVLGHRTSLYEFPWMALLNYRLATSGTDFRCTGTVINDWYILTAAHCLITSPTLQLISVRVGEHTINTDPDCEDGFGNRYCADPVQDFEVAEVIPHPEFDSKTFENDIGLIRLAHRINTTVYSVHPICLPTTETVRYRNFENTNVTVTGWGITDTGRKSDELLYATVPVVSEEQCRNAYQQRQVVVTRKQICTGDVNGDDFCHGDSGGPLEMVTYHNYRVKMIEYGVVSFGPGTCGQGFPGVYTRVDYYMDWILDNMKP
ncbi:hypothetical protein ILUMI_09660 [Ignelater luminosus]|uniref:CLIP domain-containing serine protease n=1 Tax=Ignelater luminosus TaxID=2038154 RepID=A0A8K0D3S3_IGNLU|nr:hypothetical protein ILUMI_09660 [Ignelater luminosus]